MVLFLKINLKVNIIRFNDRDKQNIHNTDLKYWFTKSSFFINFISKDAREIAKYGFSNLIFCSETMNNFEKKKFLLLFKQDMDEIKQKLYLQKDLLFQQENVSCH